jgi:hypothetical protein
MSVGIPTIQLSIDKELPRQAGDLIAPQHLLVFATGFGRLIQTRRLF